MPRDPSRSVRIDDPRWNRLLAESLRIGVTISDVIRYAVDDFLDKRDAA